MEIHGADSFTSTCENSVNKFESSVDKMLVKIGAKFLKNVKLLTPVDTGVLRNNWKMTKQAREVIISNNTDYVVFVELGHRTRGGKGYVEGRYMMTKTVEQIERELENEFSIFIDQVWG